MGGSLSSPHVLSPLSSDTEDISGDAGITDENRAILERVRMNTRQEYLAAGKATGSVRATDRLMRELQDIYRSKNYKSGKELTFALPPLYMSVSVHLSCRYLLSGAD